MVYTIAHQPRRGFCPFLPPETTGGITWDMRKFERSTMYITNTNTTNSNDTNVTASRYSGTQQARRRGLLRKIGLVMRLLRNIELVMLTLRNRGLVMLLLTNRGLVMPLPRKRGLAMPLLRNREGALFIRVEPEPRKGVPGS
eukprot:700397-Pelagomonas_calceolata.AAC.3